MYKKRMLLFALFSGSCFLQVLLAIVQLYNAGQLYNVEKRENSLCFAVFSGVLIAITILSLQWVKPASLTTLKIAAIGLLAGALVFQYGAAIAVSQGWLSPSIGQIIMVVGLVLSNLSEIYFFAAPRVSISHYRRNQS
jgi:hypothetical protein